jgi:transposase
MLASLDPLGLPLMTSVLAGNAADDGLYLPAIDRVRSVLGRGDQLYIADGKMSALATRAAIAEAGDFYLTPDAQTGRRPERLRAWLEPVWAKQHRLAPVLASPQEEESKTAAPRLLAVAYEGSRQQQTTLHGEQVSWDERVLVVFSLGLARAERRALSERLQRAEAEITALTPERKRGRRRITDRAELEAKARAVFKKHRVEGLLELVVGEQVEERQIGKYGLRPARIERRVDLVALSVRNTEALAEQRRQLGWRLYLTNAPRERVSVVEAVLAYRGAPRIERNFSRLKGRPLGLRPLYVKRDDHARGMVRLLSLGLRVLAGVEFVARKALAESRSRLEGLYAGNPKRTTARPTTERLLEAFAGITLTVIVMSGQTVRHLTPLSEVQRRILSLLGLPSSVYEDLAITAPPIPP